MKISEIMTTNVECVTPESSIPELAHKMKTLDVGFLGICDNDRLVGSVTDRDIVVRAIAGGRDVNSTTARDIMTPDVIWCSEDDDVKTVAEKMRDKEVRRIVILNKEKRLVGVVSLGDISKVEEKESGKTLKDIAEAA
jgi:CBS domain-containing protein